MLKMEEIDDEDEANPSKGKVESGIDAS